VQQHFCLNADHSSFAVVNHPEFLATLRIPLLQRRICSETENHNGFPESKAEPRSDW
jgi:hypothetical protein